jgi:diadenosine tetraphosphate (Ap4A) HIT family hydrolase
MTSDPSCVFCRIIAGHVAASIVYRDDLVTAFMDAHPVVRGHLLVVPNRHTPDLAGIDVESGGRMFNVGRRLAGALRRSGLRCEAVNFFLADGAAAGQSVFHSHLHVIPRYGGDGFGLRRPIGLGSAASRTDLDGLAAQLREALGPGEGAA